jgi:hypothetical protein
MDTASDRGLAAVAAAALSSSSTAALDVAAQQPLRPAAQAAVAETDNVAALAVSRNDGKAEGLKEGAAGERTRIKAIMTADKAKGREGLAASLAFNTDLSAEAAIAVLGDAPAASKASRLDGHVPTPKVDAEESAPGGEPSPGASAMERTLAKRGLKPAARH